MTGLLAGGLAPEVMALVVLCLAAAALALVGAVRGHQDPSRRAEVLLGPLVAALVGASVSGLLWTGWDPSVPEALKVRAVSHGAAAFLLPMVALPAVAVACIGLAWAGLRGGEGPRRPLGAAWVAGPGLLVAAMVLAGGVGKPDDLFATLRAVALAGTALVLSLAAVRGDEEGPGLRALALGLLALVLAGLEASHDGLVTLLVVGQVGSLTPETWGQGLDAFAAIVGSARLWAWLGLGVLAVVAGVAGVEATRRTRGAVALAIVLAAALLALSSPSRERMLRLAVLCSAAEPSEGDATSR